MNREELIERIKKAGKIRRWYQDVPYGCILPSEFAPYNFSDDLTDKRSFGKGRWNNCVLPSLRIALADAHIEYKDSIFCEIGCSAGMFLLYAYQNLAIPRVIGVEPAPGGFEQLKITRDFYNFIPFEIHNKSIGEAEKNIKHSDVETLDMSTFPMVDVTLLSCVHYHMKLSDLMIYLNELLLKSMFLIVITDEDAKDTISGSSDYLHKIIENSEAQEPVHKSMGKGWKLISLLNTPFEWREKSSKVKNLTCLIYRSTHLRRMRTQLLFQQQVEAYKHNKKFYTEIFPQFIHDVENNVFDETNYRSSDVFDYQTSNRYGQTKWPADIAAERTLSYVRMINSMADHGQEQPIHLNPPTMTDAWDGHHRIAVAKYFGIDYIYGKELLCSDQTR